MCHSQENKSQKYLIWSRKRSIVLNFSKLSPDSKHRDNKEPETKKEHVDEKTKKEDKKEGKKKGKWSHILFENSIL